jgi:hypothetical protein
VTRKGEKVVRLGFIKVIDVARALAPNVGDLAYGFAETTRYSVNMLQRNLCRIQRALIIAVMVPASYSLASSNRARYRRSKGSVVVGVVATFGILRGAFSLCVPKTSSDCDAALESPKLSLTQFPDGLEVRAMRIH